ncbi:uncharacterized protein BX663DRAFT_512534 [Cokeromyces recurvatus]|uniref:uncharacterized protein n=1 Tax=Cokeromyces recurvatus TaxID=90255 RepID=UPI002220DBD5|nr:uncharacterized protein BX663DRAFT_512534 [Cokeromyces recurvatus]KAI7901823.1 hypothetical protein BX663DRAFT_512534 [Cokeromyces recurvatus]
MNHNLEFEGQTAPESTRGLFESEKRDIEWLDKRKTIELNPRGNKWLNKTVIQQQGRNSGLQIVNEGNKNNQKKSNLEDDYSQIKQQRGSSSSLSFSRRQTTSVAHFNNFPFLSKPCEDIEEEDSNHLSRADVLAETEAKLNGQSNHTSRFNNSTSSTYFFHTTRDKQSRRLSEPNTPIKQYYNNYSQHSDSVRDFNNTNHRPLFNNLTNKKMSFQYTSSNSFQQEEYITRRLSRSEFNKRSSRDWRSSCQPTIIVSPSSSRPHSMVSMMNKHRLSTGSIGVSDNGNQRKPLFVSHLPFSSALPYLKSNQLVSGLLRVNKRNRSDAYVFCEEINSDIYICGSRDRNRALDGDLVAVKLIDTEQVMMEKHEKEEAKVARNNGNPIIRTPDEEDEKEIIFGGEEDVDLVTPRFCGVIVAILERTQNQVFSGTLGLTRPSNKRIKGVNDDSQQQHRDSSVPRIIWFKPTDKRVPLIAIPVEQAPPGFIENSELFENKLFLGSIKRWPITSLHPFGVLEGELGHVQDVTVQIKAILADNNLAAQAYSELLLNQTINVKTLDEKMIEVEIQNGSRRDMRQYRCITVMDEEGDFLENALSIHSMNDGKEFEIGLHVSDITAFVDFNSALDKEAQYRYVDVYHTILEKVPLWPKELKENTSFIESKDRVAFSVIWTMNDMGDIMHTWYGKTVINSDIVLTTKDLQNILNNEDDKYKELNEDVLTLYKISRQLIEHREALYITFPQIDIQFHENHTVILPKRYLDSRIILQEFQVLANTLVAQKIGSHFPDHALLQSQAKPSKRKIQDLEQYLNSLGYEIQTESPKSLQKSINAIKDEDAKNVITNLVMKTMNQKKYFCTGAFDISKYYHYSTNTPLYTHFTSPTKCYADVIVHRQLDACLKNETYFSMESETIQKIAFRCNVKNRAISNACEQIQLVFLSYYLTNNTRIPTSRILDAIIVDVQEGSFDVILPGLCLERRIHTINLPLRSESYSPSENVLHLIWIQGKATVNANIEGAAISNIEEEFNDQLIDHSSVSEGNYLLKENSIEDETESISKRLSNKSSNTTSVSEHNVKIKTHRKSTSIRAVKGEDACSTQKECLFPNECRQSIRPFDFIKVIVSADPIRSPPLVRVLAANPFVTMQKNL